VGQYSQAGRRLKILGYDMVPENVAALKAGRIDFLLSQRPETMGQEAVQRVSRALVFRESLPQTIALPLDIILKENVEGHQGEIRPS